MNSSEAQRKLAQAKKQGIEITVTKKSGGKIQGKPNHAESSHEGTIWDIQDKQGKVSKVNIDDIEDIL